jgi:molybdopterin/thiamine biosynthesis adenylyltransferase
MQLRILTSQWEPFAGALCARGDVESAGVILAERLDSGTLLARRLLAVPNDGYSIRRIDQLRIDPVMFNRLIREARDRHLSVFTIHTHPGTERPWFSCADDAGDARLMPSLFAQMYGPHGSLVVAGLTRVPVGRAWTAPGTLQPIGIRLVGSTLDVFPATPPTAGKEAWFDRQRLALGEHGNALLRELHVGIVGLGGTGSVVLTQLAHLGVGHLTLLDGDRVEESNVSRILGATRHDAGMGWKVDVAARYVERLGLGTAVRVLRGHLGADVSLTALQGCDAIFSCVDRHTPRALLNRLAYDCAVPVIDVGSAFRVDVGGRVVAGAGRVVVIGPERPCLACWGHLDPTRLRQEAMPREERSQLANEGYIQGADIPQPSVVAFNTTVAGAAVIELLRLVTRFAGADDPPLRLAFDFLTGTVRRNRLASTDACRICRRATSEPPPLPSVTRSHSAAAER